MIFKNRVYLITFALVSFMAFPGLAQSDYPKWENFEKVFAVNALINQGSYLWLGTASGALKFEKNTGKHSAFREANSGLPGNQVQAIEIDGAGNTWFGTQSGLAKYDGNQWKVFDTSNTPLPDNNVSDIATNSQGAVWIGCSGLNGGVAQFKNGNWRVFTPSNSGLPGNEITALALGKNDTLWIGTRFSGLVKLKNGIKVFNRSNSKLPENWVRSIATDDNGTIWIGTLSEGLASFNGGSWQVYNTQNSGLPDDNVSEVLIDASGKKWLGTDKGLVRFDGNWQSFDPVNAGMSTSVIRSLAKEQSSVWVGSGEGMAKINPPNWLNYNEAFVLKSDYIGSLAIDSTGRLWSGTGSEFSNMDEGTISVKNGKKWTTFDSANSGLPGSAILALSVDFSGNKWVGTSEDGLFKFTGNQWVQYNTANSKLPTNEIKDIQVDHNGDLWVISGYLNFNEGGLVKYNGSNWKRFKPSNTGLPTNDVLTAEMDKANNLWLGTEKGLVKYDGSNWKVYDTSNSKIPENAINTLAIKENGVKWLSNDSYNSWVIKFKNGDTLKFFNGSNSPLKANFIEDLIVSGDGNLWISSDEGLTVYDGKNWQNYNRQNSGLPVNEVHKTLIDKEGNKWIGTKKGLVLFKDTLLNQPAILAKGNGQVIKNGDLSPSANDNTDFGTVKVSKGPVSQNYTIKNDGNGLLKLTGSPKVKLKGNNAFKVSTKPSASLYQGDSTQFAITFDADDTGEFATKVVIKNNDSSNASYRFQIRGKGVKPFFLAKGNGQKIPDHNDSFKVGNNTDFGRVKNGKSKKHTFRIENNGNTELELDGNPLIHVNGPNPNAFKVGDKPLSKIGIGKSTDFSLEFSPGDTGIYKAKIQIPNNDTAKDTFQFKVRGKGVEFSGFEEGNKLKTRVLQRDHKLFIGLNESHSFSRVSIHSLQGKKMKSKTLNGRGSKYHQINVSDLARGMYILQFANSDFRLTRKVLIY